MMMRPAWLRWDTVRAGALLVGTMVGVGMYGIPFVMAKAGIGVGLAWLVGLAVLVCIFDLMVAELVLSTQGNHQLVGYATIWLGPWGRRAMAAANLLSLYGALLAYLIVAGEFLHNILSRWLTVNPEWYAVIFAVGWSLVWVVRPRAVALVDVVMAALYTLVVIIIAVVLAPHVQGVNLQGFTPPLWYLPYGVILFSLTGVSAVPIARMALAERARWLRPAIIGSIIVVLLLYITFAIAVVGVSGEITSPEAISGLYGLIGEPIILLGSVLGLLTISTSYVMLGTALYEIFHVDYRLHAPSSWLLAAAPPVLFFLTGLRNFIDVIGVVGALALGVIAILLLLAYLRARRVRLRHPEFTLRIPVWVVWLMIALFVSGAIFEFVFRAAELT